MNPLRAALLFIIVLASMHVQSIASELSGVIGDCEIKYTAKSILPGKGISYNIEPTSRIICITEVYPDKPDQPLYMCDLYNGQKLIFKRSYVGNGFGRVSYYVYMPRDIDDFSITIKNVGTEIVYIERVRCVADEDLSEIEKNDRFGLFGLVTPYHGSDDERRLVSQLAKGLPHRRGFYKGFSTEIPYAAWDDAAIRAEIDRHIQFAKEYGMAYFPSFVSWWSGTPINIPDGEGGRFGDIKYQQICWSMDDNEDESPELKELLGDRWSIHYGLSVPNQWSSVPWLTMNSDKLKSFRHERLDAALRYFMNEIKNSGVVLEGMYLENEPRYWDNACEAGNPHRKWTECWADFNPMTVSDARKDGVNLDPSDGLDYAERLWLHRNVARYNQATVDQAEATLKLILDQRKPTLYAHSLQLKGFPGDVIGHSMSEWAYVKGANTGLEAIWTKLADFDRVREWGEWANVNREEGDGRPIEEHLWDLRCTYARGGRLYNSYNWNAIGPERVFNYMSEFINKLPMAKLSNSKFKQEGSNSISFELSPDLQAINQVELKVDARKDYAGALDLIIRDLSGMIIGYAITQLDVHVGENLLCFDFANPIALQPGERATATLSTNDELPYGSISIVDAGFGFDLQRERKQSLYIIKNAKI